MIEVDADIRNLNLESIAYKACRDEGWNLEKVDQITGQYRVFLQLIRNNQSGEPIAPTRDVDIFWHHHILDTAKYFEDCRAVFGAYLHHYPYSGIFGEEDARQQQERVKNTRAILTTSN